jgi:myosin heavy subunit
LRIVQSPPRPFISILITFFIPNSDARIKELEAELLVFKKDTVPDLRYDLELKDAEIEKLKKLANSGGDLAALQARLAQEEEKRAQLDADNAKLRFEHAFAVNVLTV